MGCVLSASPRAAAAFAEDVGIPLCAEAAAAMPQPDMTAAALAYAAMGWLIFPVHNIVDSACSCERGAECHSPGKHPRTPHGFKDASTNPAVIKRWWKQWPNANIGLWCKGLIVVDVDPRSGGEVSLDELFSTVADKYGFDTLTAISGGGGHHYILKAPDDAAYDCKPVPGIDIKSTGGLIVIAPSLHISGRRYEFEDFSVPIAPVPQWILELIKKPEKKAERPIFTGKPLNLEKFIAKHNIPVRPPKVCRCDFGGYQWDIIGGCPFQPDYHSGSPAIGVTAAGATWFGCFCGDHGTKKGWKDFRALYEPPKAVNAADNGHKETPWPEGMLDDRVPPEAAGFSRPDTEEAKPDQTAAPEPEADQAPPPEPPEPDYVFDSTLDDEVNDALGRNEPKMIWRLTALLATMDEEEYQIHRAAIKARFGDRLSVTALDKARAAKREEQEKQERRDRRQHRAEITGDKSTWHDTGNADRLVEAHGHELMYCEPRDCFAVWTGKVWRLDKLLSVSKMAEQVILDAYGELAKMDGDERDTFFKFLNKSLSRSGIENMCVVARRKVIAVGPDGFDKDPYLLNFTNGTVDLCTGVLREHRRADLISKCIPYAYDASAECPTFHKFLNRIMGGGPDKLLAERNRAASFIGYLQRLFGCALTGKPEKVMAMAYGATGNNGKTTLYEILRAALGEQEYAGQLQIESLMAKHSDAAGSNAINADLAGLQGCRFVTASEPEEGMKFSVSRLKYILGLSRIKARYLRENPFEFAPTHKLFVDCNHRPIVTDPHDAIWNRIRLIPFDVEISKEEIDTTLPEKLRAELPGIMTWLVQGAMDYIANGIGSIPEVEKATEEYRQDSDMLKEFIERYTISPVGDKWIAKTDLFNSYLLWAQANSIKFPMSKPKFEERIQRAGCREKRKEGNTIRAWEGIILKEAKDKPIEEEDNRECDEMNIS